jgi:hypothetical protein
MRPDLLASLRRLSDSELVARVEELAAGERGATVLLVAHLAELDTREAHFRAGHGSLFTYCRDGLRLAEQEAYNRIAVARAVRRFPVILDLLESGAINLTTLRLLGPHLTPANHADVLEKARGKTKPQVEELAAALWPRPDAPSFVRKLPTPRTVCPPPPAAPSASDSSPGSSARSASPVSPVSPASPAFSASTASPASSFQVRPASSALPTLPTVPAPTSPAAGATVASSADPACATRHGGPSPVLVPVPPGWPPGTPPASDPALPSAPAKRSAEVTPLSPDRYRVQITIGGDTLEKLRLAQDLLRHAVPSGDEAVILDRALTALLADIAQRKFAAVERPRPSSQTAPGSRHIPAEVRRRVWLRDVGRCAFVGTGGRRCSERAFLEFHHLKPYALGGDATVENIQLRCRSHNAHEARLYFGPGNGNGGAGSVAETRARYAASAATSARRVGRGAGGTRRRGERTRSGKSTPSIAVPGPAP